MGNSSEGKTLGDSADESPKDKDKARFASLTFEERSWLIARLEGLRQRGTREEDQPLKAELEVVLKSTPILDPILKMLQTGDQRITQVIDAALRVVTASSPPALGDALRYLVAQEVEKVIWQSETVRVMRWGAVALAVGLGAALLGGTIWGTFKVDGLLKLAKDTEVAIEKSFNAVRDEATKAQDSLRNLRDDAQQKIDKQIQEEVVARTTKLGQMFDKVQESVTKESTANTTKLGQMFDKVQDSVTKESTVKLNELSDGLRKLNSEYLSKSQTEFRAHSQATDKLWETQDQNWVKLLTDRKDVVASHFDNVQSNADKDAQTFKTNLDSALQDARQKTPELASRLQALENQLTNVGNEVKVVDEHVGGLVATHRQLDDLIDKLDRQSKTVGFISLVRVLEIKDSLALVAIILALLSMVYSFWRTRRSMKSGSAPSSGDGITP